MQHHKLGAGSKKELLGVAPKLVHVVYRSLELSEIDFAVTDGLRSLAEQRENVRTGVSQTMASLHLKQASGFSHAVDLVPYINGRPRWEWPPVYKIFAAVKQAAAEQKVALRWGGCWQAVADIDDPEQAVAAYVARKRAAGKKAFTDGPHYELL